MPLELVRVKNVDDKPLYLQHDREGDMVLNPNAETVMSLDYACSQFGNPGARNEGKNHVRDVEYAKIQVRWGFFNGIEKAQEQESGKPYSWDVLKPKIQVTDMEGKRIYMLCEDPKGTLNGELGDTRTEATEGQFVNAQIAALQAQIGELTALVLQSQPEKLAATPSEPLASATKLDESDVPEDEAFDPLHPEAAAQSQARRNAQRDDIPKPQNKPVKKDSPRTTRVGS